jgi:hypothetical protein
MEGAKGRWREGCNNREAAKKAVQARSTGRDVSCPAQATDANGRIGFLKRDVDRTLPRKVVKQ